MRRRTTRVGATLAMSATMTIGLGVVASPASAQDIGLVFYSGHLKNKVAQFPVPPTDCTPMPTSADSHIGWSGVENVYAYSTSDCTGVGWGLGTLRTYEAGRWLSFRTV
ncbi:hypothetical protein GCM10027280_32620 [Micromonospora polyrhachis]|uniref:Uncharacterized protein n=1 Tax=Micromonospora polyrhachis TaxID=1282883 RepID=A0A7W7SWB1_9ACTN|nr:hypothetical protein [Micromonospora polyrhachis]MBB4960855.1 hypothetical protein [Micromonospora polyrhachis]